MGKHNRTGMARFRVLVRQDGNVREWRHVWAVDRLTVSRAYSRRYPRAFVSVWAD